MLERVVEMNQFILEECSTVSVLTTQKCPYSGDYGQDLAIVIATAEAMFELKLPPTTRDEGSDQFCRLAES
jgi:hypothetical protein